MARRVPYEQTRDKWVERSLAFLVDQHNAEPAAMCVTETVLRAFLHRSSAQAFLTPIIGILRDRGLLDVETAADGKRTLYFTERFVTLVDGPAPVPKED